MIDVGTVIVMSVKPGLRVLVLDDEENRHTWFASEGEDLDWDMTHVWTAGDAILKLQEGPWDLVFLDHDLGVREADTKPWVNVWGPSGLIVARHIAEMATPPEHVHVHSWNPDGASDMEDTLRRAGVRVSRAAYGTFRLVRKAA